MTIRFTCSECNSVMKIKDELAGTSARCPKCKTKFVVPAPHSDEHASDGESGEPHGRHADAASTQSQTGGHSAEVVSNGATGDEQSGELSNQRGLVPVSSESQADDESAREGAAAVRPSSKLTAEFSESPTVATGSHPIDDDDAPLSLGDSHDDIEAVGTDHNTNGRQSSAPVSTSDDDHDDDLDSPSIFVPSITSPRSYAETPEAKTERKKSSAEMPVKESKRESPQHEEPFDPLKYLMSDAPAKPRNTFQPPPKDDSDLSLSDDEIESFGEPTPLPPSRPTPASINTRAVPEKVDLATAARMMKKAIKDSQAEAAHQREMEANAGYDYFLFFREFGMRGVAILVGGIAMIIVCVFVGNYVFSSKIKLPKLGYVYGTVTLDGQPLAGASVMYEPIEAKMEGEKKDRARTSVGLTDAKGYFRMMYRPDERIEGVAVGKCRVWVSHVGALGEDVPPEWIFHASVIREVTPGRQKDPADIAMTSRKDPKKK